MPERMKALQSWLCTVLGYDDFSLVPASSDASFRRYFRVTPGNGGDSLIAMDAPPSRENSRPFVEVARALAGMGLNVPEIHAMDLEAGFLLLTDLGTRPYLNELNTATVERLYGDALSALMTLQACGEVEGCTLPPYDEVLLRREMGLFGEWLLGKHLGVDLAPRWQRRLEQVFSVLVESALDQPQVWVHRDYHSRNLMIHGEHNPGILDFQDAVVGPVTYDLVSLLRDCYIDWPQPRVEEWALGYHDLAVQSGVLRERDEEWFLRRFDWMGVQRHLKAAGIFARLNHRDGKPGYLGDIPRTLGYVADVAARYPELRELGNLLEEFVFPALSGPSAMGADHRT